jgi:Tfp pilus assembly protein FimT
LVPERLRPVRAGGFSVAELLVVVGVIGILFILGLPTFITYWRTATLKAGAEELATILNTARHIAIKDNQSVCVARETTGSATRVRFLLSSCSGTAWTGPGTDDSGWIRLTNSVEVSAATASVIFNYLGAASTGGTYTVRNPVDNRTMSVVVATSGRVTIQ